MFILVYSVMFTRLRHGKWLAAMVKDQVPVANDLILIVIIEAYQDWDDAGVLDPQ